MILLRMEAGVVWLKGTQERKWERAWIPRRVAGRAGLANFTLKRLVAFM